MSNNQWRICLFIKTGITLALLLTRNDNTHIFKPFLKTHTHFLFKETRKLMLMQVLIHIKNSLFLLSLCLLLVTKLSANNADLRGLQFFQGTFEEALVLAEETNQSIFVDVYADWCKPCLYVEKEIFTDEDVRELLNNNFICYRVNIDTPEGRFFEQQYNVSGLPDFLFIDEQGKVMYRETGLQDKYALLALSHRALNMPYYIELEGEEVLFTAEDLEDESFRLKQPTFRKQKTKRQSASTWDNLFGKKAKKSHTRNRSYQVPAVVEEDISKAPQTPEFLRRKERPSNPTPPAVVEERVYKTPETPEFLQFNRKENCPEKNNDEYRHVWEGDNNSNKQEYEAYANQNTDEIAFYQEEQTHTNRNANTPTYQSTKTNKNFSKDIEHPNDTQHLPNQYHSMSLAAMQAEYHAGNRKTAFLFAYAYQLKQHQLPAYGVVDKYLNKVSLTRQIHSQANLQFIYDFADDLSTKALDMFILHKDALYHQFAPSHIDLKLRSILMAGVQEAVLYDDPDLYHYISNTAQKSNIGDEAKLLFDIRTTYFKGVGQWDKYVWTITNYMDKYPSDDPVFLNQNAWEVYQYTDNKGYLRKAIGWAEKSISLHTQYYNFDTYAHLLHKLGYHNDAYQAAHQALELAQNSGKNSASTLELLRQMSSGINAGIQR